jgi:hypothetical protein
MTPRLTALAAAFWLFGAAAFEPASAGTFSFSAEADKSKEDQADAANRAEAMRRLVSAPCQHRLKNRKIVVLIAERTGDQWLASQDRYGPLFRVIESRLKALGLKTYTQQQIKADIAQAEVEAYFKNDPDAALAASKQLGADYILRGSITSQAGVNAVVQVNEVTVNIDLTLSAIDGSVLSDVASHTDSYSGSDTLGTVVALVRERADPLVAQLYNDYCREAAGR